MTRGRASYIARTERLTSDVLIREVFAEDENTKYFKQKKKELLEDLVTIASHFDLEESAIIYCFLCMWEEGLIMALDFWEGFNDNRELVRDYIDYYYDMLSEIQQNLEQE